MKKYTANHWPITLRGLAVTVAVMGAVCLLPATTDAGSPSLDWSAAVYGGRLSDNRIGEILYFRTQMEPSHVWAVTLTREVYRVTDDLVAEIEGNLARHTGLQDHFEINGAFLLRWRRFPWDRFVKTTLSYGVGPSYALRKPAVERRSEREPAHLLVFMPVELTLAPPERFERAWKTLVRVHHRSGAYGVVSNASGSNFVTVGLRYRF